MNFINPSKYAELVSVLEEGFNTKTYGALIKTVSKRAY
jgi:hypothetical protein